MLDTCIFDMIIHLSYLLEKNMFVDPYPFMYVTLLFPIGLWFTFEFSVKCVFNCFSCFSKFIIVLGAALRPSPLCFCGRSPQTIADLLRNVLITSFANKTSLNHNLT